MSAQLTFTILGCGSSTGVPRIGNEWGACDPKNPKNRRRRCALLVQRRTNKGITNVIIDSGADIREQLNDAQVKTIDAVLYTHEHADHIHGIDDLRIAALRRRRRVPVSAHERTGMALMTRFAYCFETPLGSSYPPILNLHKIELEKDIVIEGDGGEITARAFLQDHGDIQSLGFRIGRLAYSSDVINFPSSAYSAIENLDVWIIDALRWRFHPSHLSVEGALSWIKRMRPQHAILTNLAMDLDYNTLKQTIPCNVEPAYDGLTFDLKAT